MQITVQPGTYVVAVSGGIDSVVLLDLLANHPEVKLIVAHFDHGIRPDSGEDRLLVKALAGQYKLPFVYEEGNLGPAASEALARQARYEFLRKVQQASGAKAIITAHHHDDMVETAVINMLRGTGRRGLTALRHRGDIHRPLLHLTKEDLHNHAATKGLIWREDSTNSNPRYLRNRVRHKLLPKMDDTQREQLIDIVTRMHETNDEIDALLNSLLHVQPALDKLERRQFIMLPHAVARELMAAWLRRHGIAFDQKMIERLVVAGKTFRYGGVVHITKQWQLKITRQHLALQQSDR